MKRVWLLVSTASLLLALSACTISVEPIDPIPNPEPVTASNDPEEVLATDSVSNGAPNFYQVTVPSGLAGDVIYFELETGGPVTLTAYNANEEPVRVSASPTFFTLPGELAGTTNAMAIQSIELPVVCRGPCIIVEKGSGTIYLKVETGSAGPVDYSLYAFGDPLQDSGEPDNNNCADFGATGISTSAIVITPVEYEGALETVGDVDCYTVSSVSQVTLNGDFQNTDIVYRLEVVDAETGALYGDEEIGPGNSSATVAVPAPGRPVDIRVRSANSTAGASGYSSYTLSF